MSELYFRTANFLKMLSMFMVLGSLLYFYAYVDDRLTLISPSSNDWYSELSKSYVFYVGLVIFAVFNLAMNAILSIYRSAEKYDENSLLLKSEIHKERIWLWIIYMIGGVNFLISSVITYLALLRINKISNNMEYAFLPIFGFLVVATTLIGLLIAIFNKQ